MTDYTTIRVTEDAKAQAEQSKRDDETWNDYLLRCSENPPETREFVDAAEVTADGPHVDDSDIAHDVVKRFDYAELATAVADELEARQR